MIYGLTEQCLIRIAKIDFIIDLIVRRIESFMLEDKNISQAMSGDTILNRLDKIEKKYQQ